MTAWDFVWIAFCAISMSILVICIASKLMADEPVDNQTKPNAARFLFRSDRLISHNLSDFDEDLSIISKLQTWEDFKTWIGSRFGPLADTLEKQPIKNIEIIKESSGHATLEICSNNYGHHVTLFDPNCCSPASRQQHMNTRKCLEVFRGAFDCAPLAILQINKESEYRQENALWGEFTTDQKTELEQSISDIENSKTNDPKRILLNHSANPRWIELSVQDAGESFLCYATDISDLVEAKNAQREFLQTLTKTFASLSTGLCVFDRNHRVVLFNPALVSLTKLPIDFLSARPNLMSFFDKLRDMQMMPEPKNYAAWRLQVNQMVASAIGGSYDETWTLPRGFTYRITGRPHPDGAVAFLIENITDDVVLTHQFRAQIDMRQSALDALEDAVAVFSQSKSLLFCNAALARFIKFDPDQSLSEITPLDLTARLKRTTVYNDGWHAITSNLLENRLRGSYSKILRAKHQPDLHCKISPLNGNLTMLTFSLQKQLEFKAPQPEIA